MAKRIAPIPSENVYVCVETPYKWNFQTAPHYLFILFDYLTSTKNGDAVLLYLLYWNKAHYSGKRCIHCTQDKIQKELGWRPDKTGPARKTLIKWNLIYQRRLTNNRLNSETRVILKDLDKNIDFWISKMQIENPNSRHLKYMLSEVKIDDNTEKRIVGNNNNTAKKRSTVSNSCNNRTSQKSHDNTEKRIVNKEQSSLLSRVAKGQKTPLALQKEVEGFFDREKNDSLSFILKDNSYFYPTPVHIKALENNFPNLDIEEQFSKIQLWCAAHEDRRKTRRGAKNFINRWMTKADKDRRQYTPTKPTAKAKPIESYYSEAHLKKQARKTVDQLDVQDHQIKTLVDNIKGIEVYYESIPKQFKKYSFFYQNHWAMITRYIWWLKEEVHFDNLSPKLIWTGNSMFKKFLEWSKNDTTIRLSIRDGKYA